MSEAMELSEKQLDQIGGYVKQNLGVWMKEVAPVGDVLVTQSTFERVVRVEEELKASREIMQQGFQFMEKRFEQVDKRFEEMRSDTNARFEQVDKRFERLETRLSQGQSRTIAWLTLVVTLVTGASTAITILLGS